MHVKSRFLMQLPCESPLPALLDTAEQIEKAGADFIIMPCNTAHYFLDDIRRNITIPMINMIEETAKFIKKNYPHVKKAGLVATTGTVRTGIYAKEFAKHDIEIIHPGDTEQETVVMAAIYGPEGIKAGFHENPRKDLEKAGESLIAQGAEIIIAGCTEVSLVLKQQNVSYLVIDPVCVLAEAAVQKALTLDRPALVQVSQKKKIVANII